MSNGSDEIRQEGNGSNWPGFDHPLQFCPIRPKHRDAMIRAMWSSHKQLRGFIGWAKHIRNWNNNNFDDFVNSHISATLPNQHFVFTLGEEIVGVGSLVSAYTELDTQIALWVRTGYQGKGIGQAIVQTLEYMVQPACFVYSVCSCSRACSRTLSAYPVALPAHIRMWIGGASQPCLA
jgi:GNAT superfamily N-acetyltransferase